MEIRDLFDSNQHVRVCAEIKKYIRFSIIFSLNKNNLTPSLLRHMEIELKNLQERVAKDTSGELALEFLKMTIPKIKMNFNEVVYLLK